MQPGERIGPYVLERELGRGAMGVVFAARHEANDQPVALKLIGDALVAQSLLVRFQREGRALAALQHPNIVRIHSSGDYRGRPYLALEFVEGVSLDVELKRKGPCEPRQAAALIADLAQALAHAHAQGILHRDLKPANVLLEPTGAPRLTDFGLARDPGADKDRLTRTGEVLGTPAFMAPEQANGQSAIDHRADVYGLGAVLFSLLTGQAPFRGSSLKVLKAVLEDPAPRPSTLRSGIPPALEQICLRCLAKHPGQRYPDAGALEAELRGFLAGRDQRRPRTPALAAGVLLLAGIAVATTLLVRELNTGPEPASDPQVAVAPPRPAEPEPTPERFAQARAASRELCELSLEERSQEVLTRGAELESKGLLTGRGLLHLARASARARELEAACARYAAAGARWADLPDDELASLDEERRGVLIDYSNAMRKAQNTREPARLLAEAWIESETRSAARRHALWVGSLINRQERKYQRAIEHAEAVCAEFPELLDGHDLLGHALLERFRRTRKAKRERAWFEEGLRELSQAIDMGREQKHRLWPRWVAYRGESHLRFHEETGNREWLEHALADGKLAYRNRRGLGIYGRTVILRAKAMRGLGRGEEARELLTTAITKTKGREQYDLKVELSRALEDAF